MTIMRGNEAWLLCEARENAAGVFLEELFNGEVIKVAWIVGEYWYTATIEDGLLVVGKTPIDSVLYNGG